MTFPTLRKISLKGSLLLELLIVVSILAVILVVASQSVSMSLQSGKTVGSRDAAVGLATEIIEGVRSAAEEKWQSLYGVTKSSQNYYPAVSSGKWTIATGTEQVTLSSVTYTRSFVVDNVSRDLVTREIETTYNALHDDPSTQLVSISISWSGGIFSTSEYFFRWKNKACGQTSWSSGGSGNATSTCLDATYDTKDASIDTSGVPGSLRVQ